MLCDVVHVLGDVAIKCAHVVLFSNVVYMYRNMFGNDMHVAFRVILCCTMLHNDVHVLYYVMM